MSARVIRTTAFFAGLVIGLAGDTAAALGELRSALAGAPSIDGPADLELSVGLVQRPRRRSDRRVQHAAWWDEGSDQVIATSPRHAARVSGSSAVLDPGGDGVSALHSLLFPVLSELFAARGLCVVHAAAVVHGSDAVLALGGSGQGKSTLVTAMLAAGHQVLGDDLAVLRLDAGQLNMAGIPQPLALPADLAGEPVVGASIVGDHRDRRSTSAIDQLDVGWHPLAVVILIQHSNDDNGTLQRATPREVFARALSSSWAGLTVGRADRALPFAATASRVPAWHLGLARAPSVRVQAAICHVEEAVGLAALSPPRDAAG